MPYPSPRPILFLQPSRSFTIVWKNLFFLSAAPRPFRSPLGVRGSLPRPPCSQTTRSLWREYQSKHLSSKPWHRLISASSLLSLRTSRASAERAFSWLTEGRGWLRAQLPRPPQPDFAGNSTNICTVEPADRPREIAAQSHPTFENPTHCKLLQPQQSPPAEARHGKGCFPRICSLALF